MSNFDTYQTIYSAFFVEWYIPNYSEGTTDFPNTFRFSDFYRAYDIDGNTYLPLRRFLNISPSKNQVQTSGDSLTLTLTGIESNNYNDMKWIQNSKLEGSTVTIYRGMFDEAGEELVIDSADSTNIIPVGRYKGFVESYVVRDQYDTVTGSSETTLVLNITDYKNHLSKMLSGRKTARPYRGGFYDADGVFYIDNCFGAVAKLSNSKFVWGKDE